MARAPIAWAITDQNTPFWSFPDLGGRLGDIRFTSTSRHPRARTQAVTVTINKLF
ncbi:hypothetical protein V1281_000682 [Nitrobacteraceae bacterium AZCC 2161]